MKPQTHLETGQTPGAISPAGEGQGQGSGQMRHQPQGLRLVLNNLDLFPGFGSKLPPAREKQINITLPKSNRQHHPTHLPLNNSELMFSNMVLEKTLESPLDSKEIKPVISKGNNHCIFIGRTDAEAPILWPPDAKK